MNYLMGELPKMIDSTRVILPLQERVQKDKILHDCYLKKLEYFSQQQQTRDEQLQKLIQAVKDSGNINSIVFLLENLPQLNEKTLVFLLAFVRGGINI